MMGDAERIKRLKLVVKDKKWTVYIDDKVSTLATFTIDPAKKPKTIDMFSELLGENVHLEQCRLDGASCCSFERSAGSTA